MRSPAAAIALGFLAAGIAASSIGATFVVDRLDDGLFTDCVEGVALDCSLRGAVIAANLTPSPPHTVQVPPGTFTLTLFGSLEDSAMTGDLDILQDTIIQGAGASLTIIDAGGDGVLVDRLFEVQNLVSLELHDLTVQGGRTSGLGVTSGAGILAGDSSVLVDQCHFIDNIARFSGGAIFAFGTLSVTNSEFHFNESIEGFGGAIAHQGGSFQLSSTIVRRNQAALPGGGIYSSNTSLTLSDCQIVDNESDSSGGGLYVDNQGQPTATVTRCSITHNRTTGGGVSDSWGGGIFVADESVVDLIDSTVAHNIAAGPGGGSFVHRDAVVGFEGSTVLANVASGGGGIYCNECDEILFSRSTLANNASTAPGGGVFNIGGQLVLDASTVSGNTAVVPNRPGVEGIDVGSAVYSDNGILGIGRSVIQGNCFGSLLAFETSGGSLESPGDTCGLGAQDLRNIVDPMLSQPWNFGGNTSTQLPLPGSPAIGLAGSSCTSTDQRGEPRDDGDCDAGSVERQPDDPLPIFTDGFESGDTAAWSSTQ